MVFLSGLDILIYKTRYEVHSVLNRTTCIQIKQEPWMFSISSFRSFFTGVILKTKEDGKGLLVYPEFLSIDWKRNYFITTNMKNQRMWT